jgi:hypothetical protein
MKKKHVHVGYNPLKGMLVLISSLKAGPEGRGHSRTAWLYIDVKLFTKFHCSLDSSFRGSAYPRKPRKLVPHE